MNRALVPALLFAFTLSNSPAMAMEYVDLCSPDGDCKKFSRLVMGTDHLIQADWTGPGRPELKDEQAFEVLDEAARNGINFFDTSPIYVGGVEYRLGKWKALRREAAKKDSFYHSPNLNPDRELYALSKGGFPFDLYWSQALPPGPHSEELKRELAKLTPGQYPAGTYASRLFGDRSLVADRVAEELGHTVSNLNGDITVYLMHRDDGDAVNFNSISRPKTPVRTIMEAISDPRVSGQFWMLGWSNWETKRIDESIKLSKRNPGLPRPGINSPYFSLFEMSERTIHALGVQVTHQEMMDPNFQKGIKIMPYSPLGGFSILDKPEPRWENAKKAAKEKYEQGDPYWRNVYPSIFTRANEARWHRVVAFTKEFNRRHHTSYTVDQMLNAYVLAHPRTDLLAIGPITKEQVRRTVGSLELSKKLTLSDLEFLYSGQRPSP